MVEEKDTSEEATPSQIVSLEGVTVQNVSYEKATQEIANEDPLTEPKYLSGWRLRFLTVG